MISEIKRKYFDNGLREMVKEDYVTVGKIFGRIIYYSVTICFYYFWGAFYQALCSGNCRSLENGRTLLIPHKLFTISLP